MKKLADLFTASRALIALLIVLLSLQGKPALPTVILLIIFGWTTDILDGRLARRARSQQASDINDNTWFGEHDFTFDMIMVFASFMYLTLSGFVSPIAAFIYIVVAAIFIVWSGSKSITELFAFPLVALPLVIAYQEQSWAAYVYIMWILLALIFDLGRFLEVVREFIAGMRRLLNS